MMIRMMRLKIVTLNVVSDERRPAEEAHGLEALKAVVARRGGGRRTPRRGSATGTKSTKAIQ